MIIVLTEVVFIILFCETEIDTFSKHSLVLFSPILYVKDKQSSILKQSFKVF